jgi:alpha-D-ribose 1-methylphosphonate 5-triphosphate synthase subunit PhnH
MTVEALDIAFSNQSAFRALMECMARPGTVKRLDGVDAPLPFAPATAALIKSLADYESPIWLDKTFEDAGAAEWIRFHTGAPIVDNSRDATFVLVAKSHLLPNFDQFAQGSAEYPDRSTTLIVQVDRFDGPPFVIEGPGIRTTSTFSATPLPDNFTQRLQNNRMLFPCGIDLVLVAGNEIAALPRSARVLEAR